MTLGTHKSERVHTSAAICALKLAQSDAGKARGVGSMFSR